MCCIKLESVCGWWLGPTIPRRLGLSVTVVECRDLISAWVVVGGQLYLGDLE